MEAELDTLRDIAGTYRWTVTPALGELKATIHMTSSVDQQKYIVEFTCDDYKLMPPLVEFLEPEEPHARGTRHAYPRNGPSGSHFHEQNVCICAPFSRRAYSAYGGPHGDWQSGNWMALSPQFTTIGDIALLVQRLINSPGTYGGRMS